MMNWNDRFAEALLVFIVVVTYVLVAYIDDDKQPSRLDQLRAAQKYCASQGKALVRDEHGGYSCDGEWSRSY